MLVISDEKSAHSVASGFVELSHQMDRIKPVFCDEDWVEGAAGQFEGLLERGAIDKAVHLAEQRMHTFPVEVRHLKSAFGSGEYERAGEQLARVWAIINGK